MRGKGKRSNNADPGYFVEQAETQTSTRWSAWRWTDVVLSSRLYLRRLHLGVLGAGCPQVGFHTSNGLVPWREYDPI